MICLYPGTFCPPHEGHLAVARRLAGMFSEVYIVCSVNPEKDGQVLFTPEECKLFWKYYDLPGNVKIFTLAELMATGIDFTNAPMVRGVRGDDDFEYEKKVMMDNYHTLGINMFLVMVSDDRYKDISSTRARTLAKAGELDLLCEIVARPIAIELIAKFKSMD